LIFIQISFIIADHFLSKAFRLFRELTLVIKYI